MCGLKQLQNYHYEAMKLRITGQTYKKIADQVNKKAQTVNNWFNNDKLFQEEYEDLKEELRAKNKDKLLDLTAEAIEALSRNLNCNNPHAEINAAKEILNRVGIEEKTKVEEETTLTNASEIDVTFSRSSDK